MITIMLSFLSWTDPPTNNMISVLKDKDEAMTQGREAYHLSPVTPTPSWLGA